MDTTNVLLCAFIAAAFWLCFLGPKPKVKSECQRDKNTGELKTETEEQTTSGPASVPNKFKLKPREGTRLEDVPGLPPAFVEEMKSTGRTTVEDVWCTMHAVPDAFKRQICPEHQMDAMELEKTLRAYVPQSLQDRQFAITGEEWASDGPEKPDEIGYNEATFPATGNIYINVDGKLPDSVTVSTGRYLVFVRSSGLCGGQRIKKGPTVPAKDFLRVLLPIENERVAVTLPDQPENTDLVEVFLFKAAPGSFGEIEIQFAPMNPMCDPYPPEKVPYFID